MKKMILRFIFMFLILCNIVVAQEASIKQPLLEVDSSLYITTSKDFICARTQRYVSARDKYNIIGSSVDVMLCLLGKPDKFEREFHLRTQKVNNVYIYNTASCVREDTKRLFEGKVILYSEGGFVVDVQFFYGGG